MKNVKIVFEVSDSSTVVTAIGSDNITMYHMDLTHTQAEDKFVELLNIMQTMDAEIGKKINESPQYIGKCHKCNKLHCTCNDPEYWGR